MRRLGAWWLPLLLLVAPVFDRQPLHRDLVDYFLPMYSASLATGGPGARSWLNPGNGGGEAWYANPQTRVLSPLPALLGPDDAGWMITLEIAASLALLSLGCGRLARRWGAGPLGVTLSEVLGWSSGPVLSAVGVLNNLTTLAWVPWMVLAAQGRGRVAIAATALATAAAWFGGEPQLWLLGGLLAVLFARWRGLAATGVGLGAVACSVQLLPFVHWVTEGDRGPGAASWSLPGALNPSDLLGLMVPIGLTGTAGTVYVESLAFGIPTCCCILLGLRRRPLVAAMAALLFTVAMLPALGLGSLYLALTQGLVRFPSRLAILAGALLVPLAGLGVRPWLAGHGRALAVALGVVGLAVAPLASGPTARGLAAIGAGLTLASALPSAGRRIRRTALVVGLAPLVTLFPALLELGPMPPRGSSAAPWPEARDGGRVYSSLPDRAEMASLSADVELRRQRLMGYLNRLDGLVSVRSPAPVVNLRLAEHLERMDAGPAGRWWLDTLAVRWVVLPSTAEAPHAMEEVARRGPLTLYRNPFASGIARVTAGPPAARAAVPSTGALVTLRSSGGRLEIATWCDQPSWLWLAVPPVSGWRWRMDGVPVTLVAGPGALQLVRVDPGLHLLSGRYVPPGLAVANGLSLAAVAAIAVLLIPGLVAGLRRTVGAWGRMRGCGMPRR